ncbi:LiaI-LiaF-like domain-containing protein [Salibacterium aidingense]|uniref:LiaI-LiaF-like domain-containing protein n=1 Tax=Salibacterium aidingense TaxID=384933 RepID=UPI00042360A4|nr:DUF5668 domain-containing protein [Salibacterium aidingense]
MKKQSLFYGIIVTGLALMLLFQNWEVTKAEAWMTWPSLLIVGGAAFLAESAAGRIPLSFLPGLLMLFFGLHFHLLRILEFWPDHPGMYFLYFGLAIVLDFLQTRNSGWFTGILLLLTGAALFYSSELRTLIGEQAAFGVERFGPLLLLLFGLYLLFLKKNR